MTASHATAGTDWPTGSAASERIIHAGVLIFSEKGYLATTVRDITSACGVTAGAFYNHMSSKEDLLYTIVDRANRQLEADLDGIDLPPNDPVSALESLVQTLVTFNLRYSKAAHIANREYIFLQGQRLAEVVEHRRKVRALFESVLASAKTLPSSAEVMSDSMQIRLLTMDIVNLAIACSDWYHDDGTLSIAQVSEHYCHLAARMAGF